MDSDDNVYLTLYDETKVVFNDCITVEFIGGDEDSATYDDTEIGMGNEYMNETVSITLAWEATQMLSEAAKAKLGVDLADLTMIVMASK